MGKRRQRRAGSRVALTKNDQAVIEKCVGRFESSVHLFENAAQAVKSACLNDPALREYIHFIKHRLKDPGRLRAKLLERALEDRQHRKHPTVNETNLFQQITDLAGVRILHLHTDQIGPMNERIRAVFREQKYRVWKPVANIWDREAEGYFRSLGFRIVVRDTMYTSVHYDVQLNTATGVCCELQVRTLAEELWGEVSHTIHYPNPTSSIACQEQLKVLARLASGCTRLVDSIFRSREEFDRQRSVRRRAPK